MLDKKLLCTGAAIAAVIMIAVVASTLPAHSDIVPLQEMVSDVEKPESSQKIYDYAYMLKEHSGRIGVFAAGSAEPDMMLDVMVKYLPDLDRAQLAKGIKAKSYAELVNLIEDYSS